MKFILTTFVLLSCLQINAQDRMMGPSFVTRSEVLATNGMAATSQPLATQVALDILKRGGSAVDAAIAANACLGLMEPTGCGLGGDLFAIVWDAGEGQLHGLNASGRSPASLTPEYFEQQGLSEVPYLGALSVSVPGCVDGWFQLHGKFGKLPMAQLLQPAIDYARKGFPVSEVIAFSMAQNAEDLKQYPGFRETFMPGGRMPQKGEIFKNPDLANTLSAIATAGRAAFYEGDIARTIAAYMKEHGGFLSYEDLKNHRSEWTDPVSANYRGYEVWELPPNGQGIAALQMLNILEAYDLASMGFGSPEYLHLLVEAKKLAFEDRARFYADPAFRDIPVTWLISKEYADKRRQLIDPEQSAAAYEPGELRDGDTIYLTVADKDGTIISLIQSNYSGMGSGMTPPGLGFVLQNRGALFSLSKDHFNAYEPGKRPFHTIIPAFVTKDGKPYMSFGVMGGSMQPQEHVQILVNHLDFGMNVQEAGDAPRINHSGSSQPTGELMSDGGRLYLESGFAPGTLRELGLKGHRLGSTPFPLFGGYQAILVKDGVYYGASESRKDGQAAGY